MVRQELPFGARASEYQPEPSEVRPHPETVPNYVGNEEQKPEPWDNPLLGPFRAKRGTVVRNAQDNNSGLPLHLYPDGVTHPGD